MMTDMDDGADPEAEVVSLSPRTLLDSSRYACEICGQMFRREQNLVFHRRGHDMPPKKRDAAAAPPRKKRRDEAAASRKKRAFVCPEPSCLHHHPSHALADHCGIKKHFLRKHDGHRQWACARCSKAYAVLNDYKAHVKTCGGHSCGSIFTRSSDGLEGELIAAFQVEYEEEMLNEEEEEPRRPRKRREFIRRDRLGAHDRLFEDYFADDCNYPPSFFRRRGEAPVVNFTVNGHEYNYGYYLADGIYPSWPVFMKGVTLPQSEKQRMFTAAQSAWRKDVECAFGVLKARFNILAVPGRSYSRRTLGLIMRACVILHNMIIDDERGTNLEHNYETVESNVGPAIHHHAPPSLAARIQMDNEMRDSPVYTQLQQDLIEHVWAHNA
ncbi:hypothetical protein QYE76_020406 [Lolium multiflorum]|uniref:C2H2-type domain-containing protein n=1 Tax=Lolium multiflorum TaxID=4521 RepID=A0AAD8R7N7_LOLMU|nr:hypothetical protein QYE76_020406 [Lolium multiflorum]